MASPSWSCARIVGRAESVVGSGEGAGMIGCKFSDDIELDYSHALSVHDEFVRQAAEILARGEVVVVSCAFDEFETVYTPVKSPDGSSFIRSERRPRSAIRAIG